ncbi:Spo0E family sporulation regulatory protein-aspartic acid phosphatase [Clostridiaceae bacterium]|nr:Spo0E family sporulation regulatory protein-aspartic acid phosphatase [Lachnospiraceae bacterium]NBH71078.1 Spo0E family sporulation regulatory protein-aspartic acid phosphatase [Clostridiaceae bacterium]RKI16824.1 Spo0E family sporulation regulatory protein-aspartic acid phosphatase [bacterium 1XD21-70]
MKVAKEELVKDIERARERLDSSIEKKEDYEAIYQNSLTLDQLIEQYIASGF